MVGGTDKLIVCNECLYCFVGNSDEIGGSNGMLSLLMTKFVSCHSFSFLELFTLVDILMFPLWMET